MRSQEGQRLSKQRSFFSNFEKSNRLMDCSVQRGVLLLLCGQLLADGEIGCSELRCLQLVGNRVYGWEEGDLKRLFGEALALYVRCGDLAVEIAAKQLRRWLSSQDAETVIKCLIAISGSDQQFHRKERQYLLMVARRLGLKRSDVEKLWSRWALANIH